MLAVHIALVIILIGALVVLAAAALELRDEARAERREK